MTGGDEHEQEQQWTGRVKALARTVKSESIKHQQSIDRVSSEINGKIEAVHGRIDAMSSEMNGNIARLADQLQMIQQMLQVTNKQQDI